MGVTGRTERGESLPQKVLRGRTAPAVQWLDMRPVKIEKRSIGAALFKITAIQASRNS